MAAWGLAVFIISSTGLDWYLTWKEQEQLRKFTKPMPLVLLVILIGILRPGYPFPINIFTIGLLFGLAGDVLLLFHGSAFFILGLLAFLAGHLFYIVGFNIETVESSVKTVLLLLPVGVALGVFSQKIIPHVEKKMRVAVWLYAFVLVTMMYSTFLTTLRSDWQLIGSILAIIGGVFFVASDTMLALDRFVKHQYGVFVMVTYHLAQMAIAASILIQY